MKIEDYEMKQATEPMGFVVEQGCPYVHWEKLPGTAKVFVVPTTKEPDGVFANCPGSLYRITSIHSWETDDPAMVPLMNHPGEGTRLFDASKNVCVCEHMGHLCE